MTRSLWDVWPAPRRAPSVSQSRSCYSDRGAGAPGVNTAHRSRLYRLGSGRRAHCAPGRDFHLVRAAVSDVLLRRVVHVRISPDSAEFADFAHKTSPVVICFALQNMSGLFDFSLFDFSLVTLTRSEDRLSARVNNRHLTCKTQNIARVRI